MARSATFGNGTEVGTGNFSVYSSNGNSTTVYNLKPGTTYYFAVYEYNGLSEPVYKKPAFTTSVTTRAAPTIPSSEISPHNSRRNGTQNRMDLRKRASPDSRCKSRK